MAFTIVIAALPASAQESGAAAGKGNGSTYILGKWVGSRLQCRKEESGPVKCGTPTPFRIEFRADGTGSTQSEGFPPEFVFESMGKGKVIIISPDKSRKLELFDLKIENEFLSFQAYIYPETVKEVASEYTHYVFDLTLEMGENSTTPKP